MGNFRFFGYWGFLFSETAKYNHLFGTHQKVNNLVYHLSPNPKSNLNTLQRLFRHKNRACFLLPLLSAEGSYHLFFCDTKIPYALCFLYSAQTARKIALLFAVFQTNGKHFSSGGARSLSDLGRKTSLRLNNDISG